jgi:hypothetical protein
MVMVIYEHLPAVGRFFPSSNGTISGQNVDIVVSQSPHCAFRTADEQQSSH